MSGRTDFNADAVDGGICKFVHEHDLRCPTVFSSCGILRHIAACCAENDAARSAAPRGIAPAVNEPLVWRYIHGTRTHKDWQQWLLAWRVRFSCFGVTDWFQAASQFTAFLAMFWSGLCLMILL